MTPDRQNILAQSIAHKTKNLTVILDNLNDKGNINACFRSAENLGLVDVHVIESGDNQSNRIKGKIVNRAAAGAAKWLNIHKWKSAKDCCQSLKLAGFQLVALTLNEKAACFEELDFLRPTALVVGNEVKGISQETISFSDHQVSLPSWGLTESYNVAVACALGLYTATLSRGEKHADLTSDQRQALLADYLER